MPCEFCDQKSFDSQIVYQNQRFFVLLPKRPVTQWHFMIIPKRHMKVFDELQEDELGSLSKTIAHLKSKLSKKTEFAGYNLLSNNGDESIGQHISHFHQHIFFRFKDETVSPFEVLSGKGERVAPDKVSKLIADYKSLFL